MDRKDALTLVKDHVHRTNLLKHILAVEAIMRESAKYLNEDVERWGILGLLHDLDFDETYDTPKLHGTRSVELLTGKIDEELLRAIKAHGYIYTGVKPESKMEKALIAADAVSGLIIACALVMPRKKISEVKPENVGKRLKEKDFARNCNREHMLFCEQIGLSWPKFAELALRALQGINRELDL